MSEPIIESVSKETTEAEVELIKPQPVTLFRIALGVFLGNLMTGVLVMILYAIADLSK